MIKSIAKIDLVAIIPPKSRECSNLWGVRLGPPKAQLYHLRPEREDFRKHRGNHRRVYDPRHRPGWRRIVDAILHQGPIAVRSEMMLMPPASVGARLLRVGEKPRRFPFLDQRGPSHRKRADSDTVSNPKAAPDVCICAFHDLKSHPRRRHRTQIRGAREKVEDPLDRRIESRLMDQDIAGSAGLKIVGLGARRRHLIGQTAYPRPVVAEDIVECRVDSGVPPRKSRPFEARRPGPLASEEHRCSLAERELEKRSRHPREAWAMQPRRDRF